MKVSHNDLIHSAAVAEEKQRVYLRERGWTHDSHYPDCHWRWSKKIEWKDRTRTICMDQAGAISVQQGLDCETAELDEPAEVSGGE